MIKNKRLFFFIIFCCSYIQFIQSSQRFYESEEDLTLSSKLPSMSSLSSSSLDDTYGNYRAITPSHHRGKGMTPLFSEDSETLDMSDGSRSRNSVMLKRIQSRLNNYTPRGRSLSSASPDVSSFGQYMPVDFSTPVKGRLTSPTSPSLDLAHSLSSSELLSGQKLAVRFSPVVVDSSGFQKTMSKKDLSALASPFSPGSGNSSYQRSVTPVFQKGRLTPISIIDRDAFSKDIDSMTDSPGRSKNVAAKAVIDTIVGGSFNKALGFQGQQQLLNDFNSNQDLAPFFSYLAQFMSPDEIKEYAVVVINHAMYPRLIKDSSGLITKVTGGHNLQIMVDQNLIKEGDNIFVGQDDKTVGAIIAGSQKTMRSDFDVNYIMDFMQNAKWIAQNVSSNTFKISQMPSDNTFIGSYQKPDNPFIYQSLFPVIVVNGSLVDENNNVYVGRFTQLSKGAIVQRHMPLDKEFFIPRSDLYKMINASNKKFTTSNPLVIVSDVTDSMSKRFQYKFPVPIYGLLDQRSMQVLGN